MAKATTSQSRNTSMHDVINHPQERSILDADDVDSIPQCQVLSRSENFVDTTQVSLSHGQKPSSDDSGTDDDVEGENKTPGSSPPDIQGKREQNAALDEFFYQEKESLLQEGLSEFAIPATDASLSADVLGRRRIIDSVRDYQSELFARARASNVIAVLDTGSGKTLIAALLVRDIVTQEMEDRARGKSPRTSFFLTTSVALAEQQYQMLRENLAETPTLVHGRASDRWREQEWKRLFDDHAIIVCTAQILYQCLNTGYIKIEDINLLIFDEAHHTKKEHPYARIIKDHYLNRPKSSLRPKIFGTTASPVDGKKDLLQAAYMLESLLHAKIVTTKSLSLDTFTPKATVQEWEYAKLSPPFETTLCQQLKLCQEMTEFESYLEEARRISAELGAWCSDQEWRYIFGKQQFDKLTRKYERPGSCDGDSGSTEKMTDLEKLNQAEKTVKCHFFEEPRASNDFLSPKVLLLHEKLSQHFSDNKDTRCLVFIDRRKTAHLLLDLFLGLEVPNLRPDMFVGVGSDRSGQAGVTGPQARTLKHRFESGQINCLFCTSVAEEGIDSPECNLVVRFDLYGSMISYVQSRGRARARSSIYGQLIERGKALDRVKVEDAYYHESQLRDFLAGLDDDRFLESDYLGIGGVFSKDAPNKTFATSAGTRCSYRTSIQCLEGYANSLRHQSPGEVRVLYEPEISEGMFKFRTILPDGSPVKGAVGEAFPNKTSAKQSAAWETCFALRAKGLLDDRLNSKYSKQRPANANMRLAVSSSKKDAYPMLVKPNFWSMGQGQAPMILYATIIQLVPTARLIRAHDPLLLLTRSPLPPLPDFPVYLDGDVETRVIFVQYSTSYPVSPSMLASLKQFTLQIFQDLFNKNYEAQDAQIPYWLAPTKWSPDRSAPPTLTELVDFDIGKTWEPLSWSAGSDPSSWCGKFLIDKWSGKYRYWSHEVLSDLNIESPIPTGVTTRRFKGTKASRVLEYTLSLYGSSKARFLENCDRTQPVLRAELVHFRRNFLDKGAQVGAVEDCQHWYHICPEPLRVSTLPHGLITTALVFPAIISRVDSYLIATEACLKLGLDIKTDLALEAITKNTDNTTTNSTNTEEQQVQIQRGMGRNYERLEFLGDAFLKMATTIMVFLRYPSSDEFESHVKRMEMICNLNLFNVAVDPSIGLPQYVRTEGFNRRYWYPEGMVLRSGKGAVQDGREPFKHHLPQKGLSDKTIADVSEALIGAALLSPQKGQNEFDIAIRAVTKLVNSKDHDIQCWSDYSQLYQPPLWSIETQPDGFTYGQNSRASQIQKRMGYTFRHARLLRSAMTHPSFAHANVPNYQRLEFLGDALLDMACIRYLYERFPDRDPQWLTEHKMAMVSNKFLSALAVDLEFDKYLDYSGAHVGSQISDFAFKIRERLAEAKRNQTKIEIDFWTQIDQPPSPKCLSDSVESYVGAVFVDSGFDYSQIERFFDHHISWYFSDMAVYDTFANKQPTTELSNLFSKRFRCLKSNVLVHTTQAPAAARNEGSVALTVLNIAKAATAAARVTAVIVIHGTVVKDVTRQSGRYAKIAVCKELLNEVRTMSREQFRIRFGCRCRSDQSS